MIYLKWTEVWLWWPREEKQEQILETLLPNWVYNLMITRIFTEIWEDKTLLKGVTFRMLAAYRVPNLQKSVKLK